MSYLYERKHIEIANQERRWVVVYISINAMSV